MTHIAATNPTFTENPIIDTRALRDAFGTFATGVTVATTTTRDGTPVGFTANSFTSVSLDPPLILVCIADSARGYQAFKRASFFGINILSAGQQDISNVFASRGADKFQAVDWRTSPFGAPALAGVTAFLECAHHSWVDAGDHGILIGRVVNAETSDAKPLCYHRGRYAALAHQDTGGAS